MRHVPVDPTEASRAFVEMQTEFSDHPQSDGHAAVSYTHLDVYKRQYLVWLGIEGLRFRGVQRTLVNRADSLRRGVIANFLNPSPYLFWLAIGAPTVLDAWRYGWSAVAAFIVAFYVLLVGSKILLAVGVGYAGVALHSRGYVLLMRGLGLLLVCLLYTSRCV